MTIEVKPLNAIVYNQEKVNMADVIAPPYDVILDDYRNELENRSDFNIVKLILANNSTDLSDENNRYNVAFENYQKWLSENILVKTEKPCILYLIQNYEKNGKKITRKGFIARNRIEDFSSKNILPHEYTMGGPKADRLNLTKKCKANFSQVFLVYSDPQKQIENAIDYTQKPFIDVTDDLGVQNIVYKIDDEKTLNLIEKVLSDKTCLIADGHHRYETAMNYRNEMRKTVQNPTGNEPWNYVMSYFTNLEDDLLIFPTHRIITRWVEPYVLLEKVKKYFDVEDFTFDGKTKAEMKAKLLEDYSTVVVHDFCDDYHLSEEERAEKNRFYEAFKKFEGNPFSSLFCTGNLRSFSEQFYQAITRRESVNLKKCSKYLIIICVFMLGVIIGDILTQKLLQYACLLPIILLLSAALLMRKEKI